MRRNGAGSFQQARSKKAAAANKKAAASEHVQGERLSCPLCIEELDSEEINNWEPCPCGYKICLFCFDRLKNEFDGKCPNCRIPYGSEAAAYEKRQVAESSGRDAEPATPAVTANGRLHRERTPLASEERARPAAGGSGSGGRRPFSEGTAAQQGRGINSSPGWSAAPARVRAGSSTGCDQEWPTLGGIASSNSGALAARSSDRGSTQHMRHEPAAGAARPLAHAQRASTGGRDAEAAARAGGLPAPHTPPLQQQQEARLRGPAVQLRPQSLLSMSRSRNRGAPTAAAPPQHGAPSAAPSGGGGEEAADSGGPAAKRDASTVRVVYYQHGREEALTVDAAAHLQPSSWQASHPEAASVVSSFRSAVRQGRLPARAAAQQMLQQCLPQSAQPLLLQVQAAAPGGLLPREGVLPSPFSAPAAAASAGLLPNGRVALHPSWDARETAAAAETSSGKPEGYGGSGDEAKPGLQRHLRQVNGMVAGTDAAPAPDASRIAAPLRSAAPSAASKGPPPGFAAAARPPNGHYLLPAQATHPVSSSSSRSLGS